MICWHDWTKWMKIDRKLINVFDGSFLSSRDDLPVYRKEVLIQARECKKWGFTQLKKKEIRY